MRAIRLTALASVALASLALGQTPETTKLAITPTDNRPTKDRPAPPSVRFGLEYDALTPLATEALDIHTLVAQDRAASELDGLALRNGVALPINDGPAYDRVSWRDVPGGRLWSAMYMATGAYGARIHVTDMHLPPGGELWIYAPDTPDHAEGPYLHGGPRPSGDLWSYPYAGETVIVEYFEPADVPFAGTFEIDSLMYLYRPLSLGEVIVVREGNCHNDVMCFPDWHPLHNATARIDVVVGSFNLMCSGTLLATENNDLTPLFLTANHCIGTQSRADTVTATWFWQRTDCAPAGTLPSFNSLPKTTQANLLSTSSTQDYSLLMFLGVLPDGLTWSGWDTNPVLPGWNVAGIHHPTGAFKRFSAGLSISHPFGDNFNFVGVNWTSGTIEEGSSGSGLYRAGSMTLVGVASHSADPTNCEINPIGPSGYGRFARIYPAISTTLEGGSDDVFEPNDTCAEAAPLDAGTQSGLVLKSVAEDWYRITVPACSRAIATASFVNDHGDVDLEVYDACGGTLVTQATAGISNSETVQFDNATTTEADYYLRVFLGTDTRNEYDLNLTFVALPDPCGCPNDPDGAACDSDLDGDCVVNNQDLGILLAAYLSSVGDDSYNVDADLSPPGLPDGEIDNADLGELLADYLNDCN